MTDLYSAILRPSSPNFEEWNQVLGSHRVPLESPRSQMRRLSGEEKEVEVYRINLQAMTLRQRANLLEHLARKLKLTIDDVEALLRKDGMPIRAADVIVSYNMRAFV
jgi:hypothetical protein